MSTQSAPCPSNAQLEFRFRGYGNRRVSLSISKLAGAADTAYSAHSRLDLDNNNYPDTNNLYENSSDHGGFHLKKRKASENDTPFGLSINADFLSGIFEDIALANANSQPPETDLHDHSVSRKKSRLSMTRSISRCPKSFACLHSISEDSMEETMRESDRGVSSAVSTVSNSDYQLCTFDNLTKETDQANSSDSTLQSPENIEASNAASIVDTIFDMDLPLFPNLPASISTSSNSSNNLTQTSGQAAPEPETSQNLIEGEKMNTEPKDSYGWFIETEDDVAADAVSPLTVLQQAQHKDIAFKVAAAPKSENYDAELEWARAADTVDDVLADFF